MNWLISVGPFQLLQRQDHINNDRRKLRAKHLERKCSGD